MTLRTQAGHSHAFAKEAAQTACMTYMREYKHENSTIEEIQGYAVCVNRVYPASREDVSSLGVDLWIIMAIVISITLLAVGVLYLQHLWATRK